MNSSSLAGNLLAAKTLPMFAFLILTLSTGCTSIRSTMYAYDGCQDCERVKKHLTGVPTTLEVPTNLQVTVQRTRWGKIDVATGNVTFVKDLETQDVVITPYSQKEIFTVDFKRPAAGKLDYKLGFNKEAQYITNIDNSLTDTTIKDITGLVAAVIQSVPVTRSVVRDASTPAPALVSFTDVVASEVFPLREPGVQERIQEFITQYVNHCHSCKTVCPRTGP